MIRTAKLVELQSELPGHRLLLTFSAGLPLWDLDIEVRLLARERISAVHEYVLRGIAMGLRSPAALDLLLGLGEGQVRRAIAYLLSLDLVDETGVGGLLGFQFDLTEAGRDALLGLVVRRPLVQTLSCVRDSITGELRPKPRRTRLMGASAAAGAAFHALPVQHDAPDLGSLDKRAVQLVVREIRKSDPAKLPDGEVLDVLDIVRAHEKYRVVDVAVFDDGEGTLAFRVLDRGARLKGYEPLLSQLADLQPEVLPHDLRTDTRSVTGSPWLTKEDLKQAQANADALAEAEERAEEAERVLQTATAPPASNEEVREPEGTPSTREQLESARLEAERNRAEVERLRTLVDAGIRYIDTEEHRMQMERAFQHAKEMVIIVSPWLTRAAVDAEMRRWIFGALERGVDVIIGWGYPDEGQADNNRKREQSLTVVNDLLDQSRQPRSARATRRPPRDASAAGKRGRLRVVELGDTHAKVLIADCHVAIVGSFNWLSFSGKRRAGQLAIRQERSTRIGIPDKVRELREQILSAIEKAEVNNRNIGARPASDSVGEGLAVG